MPIVNEKNYKLFVCEIYSKRITYGVLDILYQIYGEEGGLCVRYMVASRKLKIVILYL